MTFSRVIAVRFRRAVLGVVTVVAAVLVACGSDKSADEVSEPTAETTTTKIVESPAGEAEPVAEFSGTGDDTTDAFKVAQNWELRWRAVAGKPFTIELLTKDGKSRGQVIRAGEKAQGTTFVSEAGEFKLKVSAGGQWSVQVVSQGGDG